MDKQYDPVFPVPDAGEKRLFIIRDRGRKDSPVTTKVNDKGDREPIYFPLKSAAKTFRDALNSGFTDKKRFYVSPGPDHQKHDGGDHA